MSVSVRSLENLQPFTPGTSGAKGLPKRLYERVHRMARARSVEALEVQLKLMKDANQPGSVRLAAANAILDRAWGKAPERVELGDNGKQPMLIISIVDPGASESAETLTISTSEPETAEDCGFQLHLAGGK